MEYVVKVPHGNFNQAEAEESGVFGVPSIVVAGELFWGREHLPDIRELLSTS